MPKNKEKIDLGKYPKDERNKFDALIAALSRNDFTEMDAISDQFTSSEEQNFGAYLNDLEKIEEQNSDKEPTPYVNFEAGKFIIAMFHHYLGSSSPKAQPQPTISSSHHNYNKLKK
jgi:hypothetical protein